MSGVVVNEHGSGIIYDIVVFDPEKFRRAVQHQRFDFTDNDLFYVGMDNKRAGGHPRSTAHHQHRFGLRMYQGGQMPQHPLEAHVDFIGGSYDLAADMKVGNLLRQARHRHRSVGPFGQILVLRFNIPFFNHTPVGDQSPGDRRHHLQHQAGESGD